VVGRSGRAFRKSYSTAIEVGERSGVLPERTWQAFGRIKTRPGTRWVGGRLSHDCRLRSGDVVAGIIIMVVSDIFPQDLYGPDQRELKEG